MGSFQQHLNSERFKKCNKIQLMTVLEKFFRKDPNTIVDLKKRSVHKQSENFHEQNKVFQNGAKNN